MPAISPALWFQTCKAGHVCSTRRRLLPVLVLPITLLVIYTSSDNTILLTTWFCFTIKFVRRLNSTLQLYKTFSSFTCTKWFRSNNKLTFLNNNLHMYFDTCIHQVLQRIKASLGHGTKQCEYSTPEQPKRLPLKKHSSLWWPHNISLKLLN